MHTITILDVYTYKCTSCRPHSLAQLTHHILKNLSHAINELYPNAYLIPDLMCLINDVEDTIHSVFAGARARLRTTILSSGDNCQTTTNNTHISKTFSYLIYNIFKIRNNTTTRYSYRQPLAIGRCVHCYDSLRLTRNLLRSCPNRKEKTINWLKHRNWLLASK